MKQHDTATSSPPQLNKPLNEFELEQSAKYFLQLKQKISI